MDPRFGGNVGAMLGSQQPQGNYLQRQLQRFTGGLQRGTDRLGREYNRTDAKYFGGNLPFGVPPVQSNFLQSLPGQAGSIRSYGMPGATELPPPIGGADFIGPRSNEILRRGIEQRDLERLEQDKRYSAPGNLSYNFPIPGGRSPYRQPYLPGENIPEEDIPFIPIPRRA